MQFRFPILLAGSTLALAACGKHDNSKLAADNGNTVDFNMTLDNGAATNAEAPSPLTAQGFVNAAAASNYFEIETSKLAAGQASSSAVKKFATQIRRPATMRR